MCDVDDAVGVRGRLLEPVEILEAAATHRRAERGQGRRGRVRPGQAGDLVPGGDESPMMYEPEWPVPPVTKTRMLQSF